MDDEFYDVDGQAHFHAVISEFLELLDIYSPQFVLLTMNQLIQERSEGTLSSVN